MPLVSLEVGDAPVHAGLPPGRPSPVERTRRRGEALLGAVHAAALAEVAAEGLRGASMDRIAKRAGTGKAALYRRWPNVRALALDVFLSTMEQACPPAYPDTGTLRGDLVGSLLDFCRALEGPMAVVLRELISEAPHDPGLVREFERRFGIPMQQEVVTVLQRAMARGEIPVAPLDPVVLELPAAVVMHRLLLEGRLPSDEEVEHLIDAIVLPLLRGSFS